MEERDSFITLAAMLYVATGLGYSLGTIPVSMHLMRNRTLPEFLGIRFFEGGFIERRGIDAVIVASLALIVLGAVFVIVGFWLWNSMRLGGILALVLFPFVMLVSVGSLAPVPMVLEPVKMLLVLVGWSSLR